MVVSPRAVVEVGFLSSMVEVVGVASSSSVEATGIHQMEASARRSRVAVSNAADCSQTSGDV